MVPRVTKPAGHKHLDTFRRIALVLFNNPGIKNDVKWLKSTCKLTKTAVEQHFDDLVEFELLEQVPAKQTGDRQYYYELGPKFGETLARLLRNTQIWTMLGRWSRQSIQRLPKLNWNTGLVIHLAPQSTSRTRQGSWNDQRVKL